MLISVVIPLFNKKDYIRRAINSVLNQTHTNFELIIINDGSTDGSENVVQLISDPRIRLVSQKNGGASRARNAGIALAHAEWVAFLDADDEYDPDFLNQVVVFLQAHAQSNLSMIGTNYYRCNNISCAVLNESIKSGVYDFFQLLRNQRSPSNSSSSMVNKKKLLSVNGFPEGVRHFEDWITWCKLAFVGDFGYVNTPLAKCYSIEGSASKSKRSSIDLFNNAILVPNTIRKYSKEHAVNKFKLNNAKACACEFAVNIAGALAHDGAKILAIRMLKFVSFKAVASSRKGNLRFLLLHLFVPQIIKNIYWRTR